MPFTSSHEMKFFMPLIGVECFSKLSVGQSACAGISRQVDHSGRSTCGSRNGALCSARVLAQLAH